MAHEPLRRVSDEHSHVLTSTVYLKDKIFAHMPFDVILSYAKQETSLAAERSEMAVIGLSLK